MVAVHAATPVTTPEFALTLAMLVSLLDQDPPVVVDAKVDVPFTHMLWIPLSVPAIGAVVTVTIRVALAFAQPPLPTTL
jgi:hypothetical protein